MNTLRNVVIGTYIVAIVFLLIVLAMAFGQSDATAHTGGSAPPLKPIVCFPKKDWAPAPDRDRPCVWKLWEDGSTDVRQRDGDEVPGGPND